MLLNLLALVACTGVGALLGLAALGDGRARYALIVAGWVLTRPVVGLARLLGECCAGAPDGRDINP